MAINPHDYKNFYTEESFAILKKEFPILEEILTELKCSPSCISCIPMNKDSGIGNIEYGDFDPYDFWCEIIRYPELNVHIHYLSEDKDKFP